ncbi:MAG: hypothetical protein KY432_02390 [Acidobacteria bacterium]|nr:hypothetical protein [Acidobacteriota bacterium]
MMRDILIITAREIRDKKLLFLGSALCAVIVLATPLLPGARTENPLDVMTTAALVLCLVALMATPVALGMGVIGRDLEEQRMGFYLARPINTFSVWSGKTLGAILIAFGQAATILLIPTILGKGLFSVPSYATNMRADEIWMYALLGSPFRNVLLISVLLLSLAQFWGLGLRTRSAWLLLDLLNFAIIAALFWTSTRPFLLNGSDKTAIAFAAGFVVLVTALTMTGNAIGLQLGRSDLQRTHQWTSIVTAGLLVGGALAFAAYSHWTRSIDPSEYEYTDVLDTPAKGPWIAVEGGRDPEWNAYWTAHLLNTVTGESIAIPNSSPGISDDGRLAVLWTRENIDPPSARLHWIDLRDPDESHRTEITTRIGSRYGWIISPQGSSVAWIEDEMLQVYDLRKETILFSAKLPPDERSILIFGGDSDLHVFTRPSEDEQWTIRKVDLEEESWSVTGTMPAGFFYSAGAGTPLRFRSTSDGPDDLRSYQLRNIEDGSVISSFTANRGFFLSDGRFLEMQMNEPSTLRLSNQQSEIERTIELPNEGRVARSAEVGPGLLAVWLTRGRDNTSSRNYLVDLNTSEIRELDRQLDIRRAGPLNVAPDSRRKAIVGNGRSIYLLDLDTLATERIAGKG